MRLLCSKKACIQAENMPTYFFVWSSSRAAHSEASSAFAELCLELRKLLMFLPTSTAIFRTEVTTHAAASSRLTVSVAENASDRRKQCDAARSLPHAFRLSLPPTPPFTPPHPCFTSSFRLSLSPSPSFASVVSCYRWSAHLESNCGVRPCK